MSLERAREAVGTLTETVLADPELRAVAERATTLDELKSLWSHDAFRQAHDQAIRGVTEGDMRAYVEELSDEQLDDVTGGVLIGLSLPAVQALSPQDVYVAALGEAVQRRLQA